MILFKIRVVFSEDKFVEYEEMFPCSVDAMLSAAERYNDSPVKIKVAKVQLSH